MSTVEQPSFHLAGPGRGNVLAKKTGFIALSLVAAGLGTAIPLTSLAPLFIAVLAVVIALLLSGSLKPVQRLTSVMIGGCLILGYGFANVGIRVGPIPVPAADLLLLVLVGISLYKGTSIPPSRFLWPLGLFLGVVMLHLLLEFGTYRQDAIRDTTTAVEALAVLLGFYCVRRFGSATWIRIFRNVFLLVFAYASFYPWREWLASAGPIVGLQRNVPLLGSMAGVAEAVVAGGLFFAVFTKGAWRWWLLTWGLIIVALFQARGLYIAVPLSAIVLGWALRKQMKAMLVLALVGAVGLVALSWIATSGIQGRMGEISPSFYREHIGTLFGREGPGAGSITDRVIWARRTMEEVARSPQTLILGLGLGPDLTFGFRGREGQAVRKPHNDFLEVFARTGILGLAIFLWLLGALLIPIVRAARTSQNPDSHLAAWIVGASFVYLLVGTQQPLLGFPYGAIPLFFWLGMGVAVADSDSKGHPIPQTTPEAT